MSTTGYSASTEVAIVLQQVSGMVGHSKQSIDGAHGSNTAWQGFTCIPCISEVSGTVCRSFSSESGIAGFFSMTPFTGIHLDVFHMRLGSLVQRLVLFEKAHARDAAHLIERIEHILAFVVGLHAGGLGPVQDVRCHRRRI